VKRIRIGEDEVPVLPLVQAPWGSSNDQQATIMLESSEEEDVGSPDPNREERVIFIMSYCHFYLSIF
jgi:hypothetical protein